MSANIACDEEYNSLFGKVTGQNEENTKRTLVSREEKYIRKRGHEE